MKDNRILYHIADTYQSDNGPYRTFCKRYVTRSKLVGPHMADNARFCHDCRKELRRRFNTNITSDVS